MGFLSCCFGGSSIASREDIVELAGGKVGAYDASTPASSQKAGDGMPTPRHRRTHSATSSSSEQFASPMSCDSDSSQGGRSRRLSVRQVRSIRKEVTGSKKKAPGKGMLGFKQNLSKSYKVTKLLGRGAFGTVYLASKIAGGSRQNSLGNVVPQQEVAGAAPDASLPLPKENLFAVKTMNKQLLRSKRQVANLLVEIEIMLKLINNLNVVHIEDVYENKHSVYIVMEYCSGGDLVSNVRSNQIYGEAEARLYFQDITRLVHHCHEHNIMHRDIKPENFLKADEGHRSPLKMIDFGLATKWSGGKHVDMTGTPFYMAPEVLTKSGYTLQADMWSTGCVLYFLVSGRNPFEPCPSFNSLVQKVTSLDQGMTHLFQGQEWRSISPQLRDLTARLLQVDPDRRLTAHELLQHPWVIEHQSPTASLNDALIQRFQSSGSFNRLKRKILVNALQHIEMDEIEELLILFNNIDANGDGVITPTEMIKGLKRHGYKVYDVEMQFIIDGLDVDGSGTVDQDEFIASLLDLKTLKKQRKWHSVLQRLFQDMDRNKDGRLSREEIKMIFAGQGLADIDEEVEEIFDEADQDGNGYIDAEEFFEMVNETTASLDSYDKRLRKRYGSFQGHK